MKAYDQNLVDAIAIYEELFNIADKNHITEYFGDYGMQILKLNVEESVIEDHIEAALEALGSTREKVIANSSYALQKNIRADMISHMAKVNHSKVYLDKKFTSETIAGSCFVGAQFSNCDFSDVKYLGACFDQAHFNVCKFCGIKLPGSSFKGALLSQCDFMYSDLFDVSFADSCIRQSNFRCANIMACSFQNAVCQDVKFDLVYGYVYDTASAQFFQKGDEPQDLHNKMMCIFEMAKDEPAILKERSDWAQGWISSVEKGVFDNTEAYQREKPYLNRVIQDYQEYQKRQAIVEAADDFEL